MAILDQEEDSIKKKYLENKNYSWKFKNIKAEMKNLVGSTDNKVE